MRKKYEEEIKCKYAMNMPAQRRISAHAERLKVSSDQYINGQNFNPNLFSDISRKFIKKERKTKKVKIEELPCEQFFLGFEIVLASFLGRQMQEKRGKIQNHVKIVQKTVFLIFLSNSIRKKVKYLHHEY